MLAQWGEDPAGGSSGLPAARNPLFAHRSASPAKLKLAKYWIETNKMKSKLNQKIEIRLA
jgi:hypothetical protein